MALIHFAATLLVSAFILFLVQPLIGKLVLPKLGGTPQVWNTCMVFFQMMLLLGYFYTHAVSTKLKARQQLILHGVILLSPFLIFMIWPFWSIKQWHPPLGTNPIIATLFLLFTVVGVPFFVVSTTAPLLQKWFGLTGHPAARDPYFLYGASNLGSMMSLILYPAAIEPFLWLNSQTVVWMVAYGALVAMVFVCIAMVWSKSDVAVRPETPHHEPPKPVSAAAASEAIKPAKAPMPASLRSLAPVHSSSEEVTPLRRLRWVALAAVPSSLMLGVTSHITTDLSPVPLFWLVPLALYLLSFILVFSRWPVIWTENPHTVMVLLQPISIVLLLLFEMAHIGDIWWIISANVLMFFLTTMACHGELAKDRPSTSHLTDFYLMMSVGGVCGGLLNAIIAPLFPWVFEFNLAIIAACLLRPTIPFGNFLDDAVAKMADSTPEPARGPKARGKAAPVAARISNEPTEQLSYGIDVGVGMVAIGVIAFVTIFIWGARPQDQRRRRQLVAAAPRLRLAAAVGLRFHVPPAPLRPGDRGNHSGARGIRSEHRSRRLGSYPQLLRLDHGAPGGGKDEGRQDGHRIQDAHARHHRSWPQLQGRRYPVQRLQPPGHDLLHAEVSGRRRHGTVQLVQDRRDDGQHVPERRADAGLADRQRRLRHPRHVAPAARRIGRGVVGAALRDDRSRHRDDGQLRSALPALPLLRDRRTDPQAVAPEG